MLNLRQLQKYCEINVTARKKTTLVERPNLIYEQLTQCGSKKYTCPSRMRGTRTILLSYERMWEQKENYASRTTKPVIQTAHASQHHANFMKPVRQGTFEEQKSHESNKLAPSLEYQTCVSIQVRDSICIENAEHAGKTIIYKNQGILRCGKQAILLWPMLAGEDNVCRTMVWIIVNTMQCTRLIKATIFKTDAYTVHTIPVSTERPHTRVDMKRSWGTLW